MKLVWDHSSSSHVKLFIKSGNCYSVDIKLYTKIEQRCQVSTLIMGGGGDMQQMEGGGSGGKIICTCMMNRVAYVSQLTCRKTNIGSSLKFLLSHCIIAKASQYLEICDVLECRLS